MPAQPFVKGVSLGEATEENAADRFDRFKSCAQEHGLRLSRIYLLNLNRQMGLQGSLVMDCAACKSRWLVRVHHGELVSASLEVIEQLKKARDGQVTAPPGAPGAPSDPALSD
ncbi:MAG: hypothetical protein ACE5JD_12945 [Candidatus Methylomirabilia bacterium]